MVPLSVFKLVLLSFQQEKKKPADLNLPAFKLVIMVKLRHSEFLLPLLPNPKL